MNQDDSALISKLFGHPDMEPESYGVIEPSISKLFPGEENSLSLESLTLFCQPVVPLNPTHGHQCYFEILLRLIDNHGEINLPGVFFHHIQSENLETELDKWILTKLLNWLNSNSVALNSNIIWGINLSEASLQDSSFALFLENKLDLHPRLARKICFELFEPDAIKHSDSLEPLIKSLKEKGCQFVLDDFSTGLSSFSYLKSLNIDHIKIDGKVVKNIHNNSIDYEKVKNITEIGHTIGITVMAKFVEDLQTKQDLQNIGVDYAQGFAVSEPFPLANFNSIYKNFDSGRNSS